MTIAIAIFGGISILILLHFTVGLYVDMKGSGLWPYPFAALLTTAILFILALMK